jgi:hypothetical protein
MYGCGDVYASQVELLSFKTLRPTVSASPPSDGKCIRHSTAENEHTDELINV